mmetsp:Transcript_48906/g.57135  ORF Transcript_48906/g.57135 Transcript_48906/m.57135 type:complete len:245 (+) Transcript_48906:188-922(+)
MIGCINKGRHGSGLKLSLLKKILHSGKKVKGCDNNTSLCDDFSKENFFRDNISKKTNENSDADYCTSKLTTVDGITLGSINSDLYVVEKGETHFQSMDKPPYIYGRAETGTSLTLNNKPNLTGERKKCSTGQMHENNKDDNGSMIHNTDSSTFKSFTTPNWHIVVNKHFPAFPFDNKTRGKPVSLLLPPSSQSYDEAISAEIRGMIKKEKARKKELQQRIKSHKLLVEVERAEKIRERKKRIVR